MLKLGRGCLVVLLLGVAVCAQEPGLLQRLLTDESHQAALNEIETLGEADKTELVPRLVSVMRNGKGNQAFHAARGLAKIGTPALSALLAEIRYPDRDVAYRASFALGTMGTTALPSLLPLLEDRLDIVCLAAQALQLMDVNAAAAIPALERALERPGEEVRYCVASALGATKSPAALPGLRKAIADDPNGAVLLAIAALGPAGREAMPDVIRALDSAHGGAAARALGSIGRGLPQAVEALDQALLALASSDKGIAAEELGEMGEMAARAVPKLIFLLADPSARLEAAQALGKIGAAPDDAVPALMALWADPDRSARLVAERAVDRFGQAAVPSLIGGLKDQAMEIRVGAARHLGALRASQAVPPLVIALSDPDRSVRASAALALEQIGTSEARAAVVRFRSSRPPSENSAGKRGRTRDEVLKTISPTERCPEPLKLVLLKDVPGPKGGGLLITVHRGDRCADQLAIWKKDGERYDLIYDRQGPDEGPIMAAFREVNAFRQGGEQFIHIVLLYDGTGYLHDDTIFWVAPDLSLHPVKFISAPGAFTDWREGEGNSGGEVNSFSDERMTFVFGIRGQAAGDGCTVRGNYKLIGEKEFDAVRKSWSTTFQIVPAEYQRGPVGR